MTTTTEIDFGDFGDNCSSYLGIMACSISTHEELERTDPAPKRISATARQQLLQRVQLKCTRCLLSANVQTMDWWEKTCSAVPHCMGDLSVCHRLQLVAFMYDWSIHMDPWDYTLLQSHSCYYFLHTLFQSQTQCITLLLASQYSAQYAISVNCFLCLYVQGAKCPNLVLTPF